jgi:NAD(P)-dependent dehydrogenase (short-subunit alcohol dehydrogenase family)
MLLEKKIAIVTGASRGIGKATALKLASEGATVILTARTENGLIQTKSEIEQKGGKADLYRLDVRDEEQVKNTVNAVITKHGTVDILVNNAGISREIPLVEMPMSVWDEILETNLRAVVLMTKAVLPCMIAKKSGTICNIASAAAMRGLPGSTAYSASKAAVLCMGQALGDEVRVHGIRVNTVCPGPTDTEMFKKSERREFILKAGGDVFSCDVMANAVLFLVSSLSEGMNSQSIVVRGFNRW